MGGAPAHGQRYQFQDARPLESPIEKPNSHWMMFYPRAKENHWALKNLPAQPQTRTNKGPSRKAKSDYEKNKGITGQHRTISPIPSMPKDAPKSTKSPSAAQPLHPAPASKYRTPACQTHGKANPNPLPFTSHHGEPAFAKMHATPPNSSTHQRPHAQGYRNDHASAKRLPIPDGKTKT